MHIPENWGYLIFNDYEIDNHSLKTDLELEHTLYAVFREVKFGYLKYLNNEDKLREKCLSRGSLDASRTVPEVIGAKNMKRTNFIKTFFL